MSSFGSRSLPPPTREEVNRRERARRLGCVACNKQGRFSLQCGAPQFHHFKIGNQQAGHRFGVILGGWHHEAIPLPGSTAEQMRARFGPSLAEGSKPFHDAYGSDQDLLDYQDDLLGLPRVAIERTRNPDKPRATSASSKNFPRDPRRLA